MKLAASGALTGRDIPEWISRTPNSKPPQSVVDRVFLRQDGRCAISKRKLFPGDARAVDHIIPLKDGGLNVESNLQIIAADKHAEKTAAENTDRAKVTRTRLKHNGLWPKSRRPLRSKGFENYRERDAD